MGPLPISRTLLAFDLGIGTEARCSSSRQAFQSYQSSWPAVPSSMLVARLRQTAPSGDGDRVPEQRLFSRAPLTFEAIRTRMAARPAEIEGPEPLHACRSEDFPVQEHIGAQRQVLLQTRGPGHRETVFEGERNQAAHRRAALPYQSDPSAGSESIQDSAEESGSVHRRPEVAHSLREDLVKG